MAIKKKNELPGVEKEQLLLLPAEGFFFPGWRAARASYTLICQGSLHAETECRLDKWTLLSTQS